MRRPRPGDFLAKAMFGRDPQECHPKNICVCCGETAEYFKDRKSVVEYDLSVFCQNCQDKTFEG